MASVNKMTILGRVGKDPEIRAVGSNEVASFTVATGEKWKDKTTGEQRESTEWHNVVVWGGVVNVVKNYVKKGTQIYLEGQMKTRNWQDKDGNNHYSTEVVLQGFDSKLVLLGGGASSTPAKPAPAALDDEIPF